MLLLQICKEVMNECGRRRAVDVTAKLWHLRPFCERNRDARVRYSRITITRI